MRSPGALPDAEDFVGNAIDGVDVIGFLLTEEVWSGGRIMGIETYKATPSGSGASPFSPQGTTSPAGHNRCVRLI